MNTDTEQCGKIEIGKATFHQGIETRFAKSIKSVTIPNKILKGPARFKSAPCYLDCGVSQKGQEPSGTDTIYAANHQWTLNQNK